MLEAHPHVGADDDAWSADAIACIATGPAPFDCLEPKLTFDQQKGYQDRLERALEDFGSEHMPSKPDDVPIREDAIRDASQYEPDLDLEGDALTWTVELRHIGLVEVCTREHWATEVLQCLARATGRPSHEACLDKIDEPDDRADVLSRLQAFHRRPRTCRG